MSSWIKLFRDINKHWIWQNSDYLKWWLDILLEVKHAQKLAKNKKIVKLPQGFCYEFEKMKAEINARKKKKSLNFT